MHTAQVLLTHDDLSDRKRYLNARSTLLALLNYSVVPVINENDAVATDEIRFGDNDTLAALVANLVEADRLVILTDQDGLFNRDPRKFADATLIENCYTSGSVSSSNDNIGGLVGNLSVSSTINSSYSNVGTTGAKNVGGLTGTNDASTINNCYSTGSVNGSIAGGLVGNNSATTSVINKCFSIGH